MNPKSLTIAIRIFYPIWSVSGVLGLLYFPSKFITLGNPQQTAQRIQEGGHIYRLGVMDNLVTQLLFILMAYLLYEYFKQTEKNLSLVMLISALISVPIAMAFEILNLAPLALLANDSLKQVFTSDQIIGLTMVSLKLAGLGMPIVTIFWGLWLFPLGRLVALSKSFPAFMPYALYLGGIGYLFGSILKFLEPTATVPLGVFNAFTFGEMVFVFWMIFKGKPIADRPAN